MVKSLLLKCPEELIILLPKHTRKARQVLTLFCPTLPFKDWINEAEAKQLAVEAVRLKSMAQK